MLADAKEVDLAEIAELNRTLVQKNAAAGVDLSDLSPAPYEALPKNGGDASAWAEAKKLGEEALRALKEYEPHAGADERDVVKRRITKLQERAEQQNAQKANRASSGEAPPPPSQPGQSSPVAPN